MAIGSNVAASAHAPGRAHPDPTKIGIPNDDEKQQFADSIRALRRQSANRRAAPGEPNVPNHGPLR